MLVIVKQTTFDDIARGYGPGDILEWRRRDARNGRLEALSAGSRLFMITVRPPDERLWLIGVYPGVQRIGDTWVSVEVNRLPIVDISHLRAELKFSTGNGISLEPGKLGNSLQTPRILATSDIELLERAARDAGLEIPTYAGPKPNPGNPLDMEQFHRQTVANESPLSLLVTFLHRHDAPPRVPRSDEPSYDLGWWEKDTFAFAVTVDDCAALSTGLGKALHIATWFDSFGIPARAYLVAPVEPDDLLWDDACGAAGVTLIWPTCFHWILAPEEDASDDQPDE